MSRAGRYYRESGRCDPAALLKAAALGLPVAVAGGLAYAAVSHWSPLPVINILVCLGIAGGIGSFLDRRLVAAHVRSTPAALGVALALGLAAQYACLVAWLHLVSDRQYLVTAPDTMLHVMQLAATREITLGKPGRSASGPGVTGLGLWAVWVVEAMVLVGLTASRGSEGVRAGRYCEGCRRWLDQEARLVRAALPAVERRSFRQALEAEDRSRLVTLGAWSREEPRFTLASAQACSGCQSPAVLTVSHVELVQGKNGLTPRTTAFVEGLTLPRDAYQDLVALAAAGDAAEAQAQASPGAAPPPPRSPGGAP